MTYMTAVTIGSLVISIVAVSIAIHTKLQQRESRELRGLGRELRGIQGSFESLNQELHDPRTHEDLNFNLKILSREILACKHETDDGLVQIGVSSYKFNRDGEEVDRETIESFETLVEMYKSDKYPKIRVIVGNREKMYATDENIWFHNAFRNFSHIYQYLSKIEEQYGEKLEEFDSSLLDEVRDISDRMVEESSVHLIDENNTFEVNVEEFGTTEEIEDYAFEELFYYDGIEEDIEELEKLLEKVEELRKGILQASYS